MKCKHNDTMHAPGLGRPPAVPRKDAPPDSSSQKSDDSHSGPRHPKSNTKTQQQISRQREIVRALQWWLPELCCSILSVVSLLAIVSILRRYNNTALADLDLPRYLSLNGIIALLATLNRTFLVAPMGSVLMQEMWLFYAKDSKRTQRGRRLKELERFDAASRGTFGSLVFLFIARGGSTFIQQLIEVNTLIAVSNNSATLAPGNIPRSEAYTDWEGNPAEDSLYISLDMVGAIYSGIMADTVQAVAPTCTTGNCTWPLTPSLGFCGGCAKSMWTEQHCYNWGCMQPDENCSAIDLAYTTMCNYTMPSGNVATLINKTYSASLPPDEPAFQTMAGGPGKYFNCSDRLYVLNLDLIGYPYDTYEVPEVGENNSGISAYECALWFCIQVYNTSVTSTKPTQRVVNSFSNVTGATAEPDEMQLYDNFTFGTIPSMLDPSNQTLFSAGYGTLLALGRYFGDALAGNVTAAQSSQQFSSDLVRGMWNGTSDLDAWIANLATGMTNVLRTTNVLSRLEYDGTAYQLGITIIWVWIVLPATVVLSSFLLLVVAMIRTARSPVPAWKGSPLSLLLCEVDDTIKNAARTRIREPEDQEKAVGAMEVELQQEKVSLWRLITLET